MSTCVILFKFFRITFRFSRHFSVRRKTAAASFILLSENRSQSVQFGGKKKRNQVPPVGLVSRFYKEKSRDLSNRQSRGLMVTWGLLPDPLNETMEFCRIKRSDAQFDLAVTWRSLSEAGNFSDVKNAPFVDGNLSTRPNILRPSANLLAVADENILLWLPWLRLMMMENFLEFFFVVVIKSRSPFTGEIRFE